MSKAWRRTTSTLTKEKSSRPCCGELTQEVARKIWIYHFLGLLLCCFQGSGTEFMENCVLQSYRRMEKANTEGKNESPLNINFVAVTLMVVCPNTSTAKSLSRRWPHWHYPRWAKESLRATQRLLGSCRPLLLRSDQQAPSKIQSGFGRLCACNRKTKRRFSSISISPILLL